MLQTKEKDISLQEQLNEDEISTIQKIFQSNNNEDDPRSQKQSGERDFYNTRNKDLEEIKNKQKDEQDSSQNKNTLEGINSSK